MSAKTTLIFIDPGKEFLFTKDFDFCPPIPRIGEYVAVNDKHHQRKVNNVVYFYEKEMPDYAMVVVHVDD